MSRSIAEVKNPRAEPVDFPLKGVSATLEIKRQANRTLLETFWDSITHLIQELPAVNKLITDLL
jgi:hypothetical protein